MLKRLRRLPKRIRLAGRILLQKNEPRAFSLPEKSFLHARVLSLLSELLAKGFDSEQKLVAAAEDITDGLWSSFSKTGTLLGRLGIHGSAPTRIGFYNFSQLCAVAGVWEFKLRILAARVGVDSITEPVDQSEEVCDAALF